MITPTYARSLDLGAPAPEFSDLAGADGKRYALSSFDGTPVLAIVFIANGCPTVRVYDERLINLQRSFGDRGVQVVAVNSNNPYLSPPDVHEEMVKRAEQVGYNFPYIKDPTGNAARSYGAISTPHAFVFDRHRRLRYRGRIDDSRDPTKTTSHDLANALADVLAGRAVQTPVTEPFGCAIVR